MDQARDSHYRSFTLAMGGAIARHDLRARLGAENVETLLYGLYLGRGEQLVDNHTVIYHDQPNCRSWEVYKGILDGKSHAVFNGKVFVKPAAQKTDHGSSVSRQYSGSLFEQVLFLATEALFQSLWDNTDDGDMALAKKVLAGEYTFVEAGVIDQSEGTGPWIADWVEGPSELPSVARRFVPSTRLADERSAGRQRDHGGPKRGRDSRGDCQECPGAELSPRRVRRCRRCVDRFDGRDPAQL